MSRELVTADTLQWRIQPMYTFKLMYTHRQDLYIGLDLSKTPGIFQSIQQSPAAALKPN